MQIRYLYNEYYFHWGLVGKRMVLSMMNKTCEPSQLKYSGKTMEDRHSSSKRIWKRIGLREMGKSVMKTLPRRKRTRRKHIPGRMEDRTMKDFGSIELECYLKN